MAERLTSEQVRHLAELARLRLTDAQIEEYRRQLSSIIDYEARLSELILDGVEPLARPNEAANVLAEDEPAPPSDFGARGGVIERMAPAMRDGFIVVPKVIDGGGSA